MTEQQYYAVDSKRNKILKCHHIAVQELVKQTNDQQLCSQECNPA